MLPLETVRNILITVAENHQDILSMPSPQVLFSEFGDSFIKINLLVWISKPYKQFQIKSDIYFKIDSQLRQESIKITFPQRDLHLRSSELPSPNISPELINSVANLSHSLATWLKENSNHQTSQEKNKEIKLNQIQKKENFTPDENNISH